MAHNSFLEIPCVLIQNYLRKSYLRKKYFKNEDDAAFPKILSKNPK